MHLAVRTIDFDYPLPEELIADRPLPDRSASRMMVIHRDTGMIEHRHFCDLPEYVREGDHFILNDTRVVIALDLSSYAKAIGAGERVNRHAASLLKNAEDGDLSSFKNNLALIQSDVEQELASLRDSDMANLIGLGGWIRALDAATAALDNKFAEDKAKVIFQPDVPEYFHYILDGVEPEMKERRDIAKIMNLLTILQEQMTLAPDARPAKEGVEAIRKTTLELIKAALAPVES